MQQQQQPQLFDKIVKEDNSSVKSSTSSILEQHLEENPPQQQKQEGGFNLNVEGMEIQDFTDTQLDNENSGNYETQNPDEDLPNAVSLNSANFNGGRLIGPAVSGLLIAAFGTGPSFLINGASYFFVIFALLKLNKKTFFNQNRAMNLGNIREGIAYAKARPDIYVVMIMVFALATF